jgi:hypothetical protein
VPRFLFVPPRWEVVQLVGLQTLTLAILVRVQASQPIFCFQRLTAGTLHNRVSGRRVGTQSHTGARDCWDSECPCEWQAAGPSEKRGGSRKDSGVEGARPEPAGDRCPTGGWVRNRPSEAPNWVDGPNGRDLSEIGFDHASQKTQFIPEVTPAPSTQVVGAVGVDVRLRPVRTAME